MTPIESWPIGVLKREGLTCLSFDCVASSADRPLQINRERMMVTVLVTIACSWAAAVSIALINDIANSCGVALPPLVVAAALRRSARTLSGAVDRPAGRRGESCLAGTELAAPRPAQCLSRAFRAFSPADPRQNATRAALTRGQGDATAMDGQWC